MKISVLAKTGARVAQIKKIDSTHFAVSVKERPIEGRANTAICRVIAKHFGVPASLVCIVSGTRSKNKIIEVTMK